MILLKSASCVSVLLAVTATLATASPLQPFGVYRELWTSLSETFGNTLAALTNTAYNPNWPNNPTTNYTRTFASFETEVNTGISYYGQRLRAFVVPPASGNYTFWIASDDTSLLSLSSTESPANSTPIARVNTWTNSREWTRETNQQSAAVYLEAGRRYYLEALMQQGEGGDNLAVRWQLPGGAIEEPLASAGAPGTLLIPCTGVDAPPGIYRQTTNATVVEGSPLTLSVLVTNQSPVAYQWFQNGDKLLDANALKSAYTFSNASLSLSGQVFSCVLSNAAGAVTSTPVVVSVLQDTVAPTVIRIFNVGLTNVQVLFSKMIEPAGATNAANYLCTNGLAITGATLGSDNASVMLASAPLTYGACYSLLLNNIRDQASTPNTITPNTLVSFVALAYIEQDIGSPATPTTLAAITNGINIVAAGTGVGGTGDDQCGFGYQTRTGDFDVSVRLAGLGNSDAWAKAGLMGRETLDAGSRFAAVFATPSMNGDFFEYRDPASTASTTSGNFPANFPNAWLRLKRVGDVFAGYASYDGQTWAQLGSATIAMAGQMYVGLAVTSHNASQATTAQFRDVTDNFGAVTLGAIVNPHDTLGPCSRKTPIVISEIMYKPAPRLDGNNVEFIELYNTNPWYQDIGNYRLVADSLTYTFPAGTRIAGGAFLVIAASPAGVQNVYGIGNVAGPYTGSLKESGTLQLLDERNAVLLSVPYSNVGPWPQGADGAGHSIVLAYPTYGEGDPRAWDISDAVGGSPGLPEAYRPSPLRNVVINEFLANAELPDRAYIELYNHGTQSVDVSRCILTDDPATNRFLIPPGTVIPPRGFLCFGSTNLNFNLNKAGDTVYFKNPDQSRVLDAVHFDAQENGVSMGRWPDGASQFYRLGAKTPGASNTAIRLSNVVINELMYKPISGDDDDQFVELYNRGTNTVDLGGWTLSDGIRFTFPASTLLASNGYMVVARNAAQLRSHYANLNATNCLGDFSGKLSHNGERVALTMPAYDIAANGVTNLTMAVTVNEVTYGTGGRWPQWAGGGGSSMELIDPNSNNRLAANWADSDDTAKSVWTNIETTAVLDNGANYDSFIDYAQIGLLDVGECLVDSIEIRSGTNGANLVRNPTFDTNASNWTFQGCMARSSRENTGYAGGHSLHIRCSDRLWTGVNSCEMALASNTLASGQMATLRFKARWLHGWPEVLLRLNGNWIEATGRMPVPANLGTPGLPNSRLVVHAGPAIYEVTHVPAVPGENQPVVVTARAHEPGGLKKLALYYRIDPATNYTVVTMTDGGTNGDVVAGDGVFSGTIPGQPANAIAAFYLAATDNLGAATRFPALRNDNAPVPECVVMFGDGNPGGSFGVYHLWLTQTNVNRWASLSDLSNESCDGTMVNGNRVIYNMQGRFAGSPYHQDFDSPAGNLCHYKWTFPDDDQFLGATSFNKIHQPGNGAGDDDSIQREQTANLFLRALGVPWLNRRYVAVYVNGNRRGSLMEDAQCPDGDVVKEHWPDDADGWLYKMQPWFEFAPAPSGNSIPFANNGWCTLQQFTTTGGVKKPACYRYNYEMRRTPDSMSNFNPVYTLVDAANTIGTSGYAANLQNIADVENWMRVFAANHAAGNWDSFGTANGQNLYGYIGALGTRYSLLMWDFNIVLGNGSWGPGENLFSGSDALTGAMYREPVFLRMYCRALQELVDGPLDVANSGPLLDAKYQAFVANGQNVADPGNLKSWMTQAHDSIAAQLTAMSASASFTVNPAVPITNRIATITGSAPVCVKTVLFNGVPWPVTWTSLTDWTASIPLAASSNTLQVTGVDIQGQPVVGASNTVIACFDDTIPSPIVINEIMCHPAVAGAEYVELFNDSTTTTFDLSGWQIGGLSYTFPAGTSLAPNAFLVLAANASVFAATYGATVPIFDTFPGTLSAPQHLALMAPILGSTNYATVTELSYEDVAPWPATDGSAGSSLQLVDPSRDNWRVGNWAVASPTNGTPAAPSRCAPCTPGAANATLTNRPAFPTLWINELQAVNLTGPTNGAGQRTAWLELYNPGTNTVSLDGLYLANNYTNLAQWAFPDDAAIQPGQFQVIFADGLTNLSTSTEWHAGFVLPRSTGSLALSRFVDGQNEVLDYVNYSGLGANHSYGSYPDGQSFVRQEFFYVTPGATNRCTAAPPTVMINEWMAGNTHTITNPVGGKYSDWFELYNYGSNTAKLAGCYLTDSLNTPFKFRIPDGYAIPPHGFLLVWADSKSTTNTPDLHVNFKLSKSGESIGLYAADGTPLDYVNYGAQSADISQGRYPDGGASICFMHTPTPRTGNAMPIVTLGAPVPVGSKIGPANAVFSLTRTGDLNASIDVALQIAGTATNGVDYCTIASTILLPAGCAGTNITVTPIPDDLAQGDKSVVLGVAGDGSTYFAGSPCSASVTIADNPAYNPKTLTVISAHSGACPGTVTTNGYATCDQFVNNSPLTVGATRFVCLAGAVAGNDFMALSATNVTLTLTNDATLTWNWQTQYLLTTATNGTGSVTGGGWYPSGSNAVLTATAGTNAHLVSWLGDTNGCLMAGAALIAPMTQARAITAAFAANTNRALTVISPHGGALPGTTVAYSGMPLNAWVTNSPVVNGATQYVCTGATVKGNTFMLVSPTNVTLTLTNNATLTWLWSTNYWLHTATNGNGGVSVAGGWYPTGSNAQIIATAGDHAVFIAWSGQTGGCTIKSNILTAPMTSARAITANFLPAIVVTATAAPPAGGTVTGGGTFVAGSNAVTLVARINAGWRFAGWSDGSTAATHATLKNLSGDTNFVADFIQRFTVTAKADPVVGGTVTGGGTYDDGAVTTLVAKAATSYRFKHWEDASSNASRQIAVTANVTNTATFVRTVLLTVQASPAKGGGATGGGYYETQSTATLTATPSNTWRFVKWSDNNTNATLTAKANANWKFLSWADTGSTNTSRKVTVLLGGATYTGQFAMLTGEIALSTNTLSFGSVPIGLTATQTVAITNLGPNAVKFTSVTVPTGYTATPAAFTLAPNTVTNVAIVFKPTTTGAKTGTVALISDAARGTGKVAVTGTGIAATRVVLLAGDLNFGTALLHTTNSLPFAIANTGNSPLSVTALAFSGTGSTAFKVVGYKVPFSAAAGGSTNLFATFTPMAAGTNRVILTATVTGMTTGSTNTLAAVGIGTKTLPTIATPKTATFVAGIGGGALVVRVLDLTPPPQAPANGELATVGIAGGKVQVAPTVLTPAGEAPFIITLDCYGVDSDQDGIPNAVAAVLGDRLKEGVKLLTIQYTDGTITATTPFVDILVVEGVPMPLDALPATWRLTPW